MDAYLTLQKSSFTSPTFDARVFINQLLAKQENFAEQLPATIDRLKSDMDYLQKRAAGTDVSTIIAASRAADAMGSSISRLNGLLTNYANCQTHIMDLSNSCSKIIADMHTSQKKQCANNDFDSGDKGELQEHREEHPAHVLRHEEMANVPSTSSFTSPGAILDGKATSSSNPLVTFRSMESQIRLCLAENRLMQAYALLQLIGTLDFSVVARATPANSRGISVYQPSLSADELVGLLSKKFNSAGNTSISVSNFENQLKQSFVVQAACFLAVETTGTFDAFKNSLIFRKARSFNVKSSDSINSHHLAILNDYVTIFTRSAEAEKAATKEFSRPSDDQKSYLASDITWTATTDTDADLTRTILRMIHHLNAGEGVIDVYLSGSAPHETPTTARAHTRYKVFSHTAKSVSGFEVNFASSIHIMKTTINKALHFIKMFAPHTTPEVVDRLNSKLFLWAQDVINGICLQLTETYRNFLVSYVPSMLQQSFSAIADILNQTYDLLTSDLFTGLGLATHFRKTITSLISSLLCKTVEHFEFSDRCYYKTYEYSILTKEIEGIPLTFYHFSPVSSDTLTQLNNGFSVADGYWHDHRINKRSSANISKPEAVKNKAANLASIQTFPYMELLLCIEQVLPYHDLLDQLLTKAVPDLRTGSTLTGSAKPNVATLDTNTSTPGVPNRDVIKSKLSLSIPSQADINQPVPAATTISDTAVLAHFVRVKQTDNSVQLVTLLNSTMPVLDIVTATLNFIKSIYGSYANFVYFRTLIPNLRKIFSNLATKVIKYLVSKLTKIDLSMAGIKKMKATVASEGIACSTRNPTGYPYNYGYAIISTICFMAAAIMPSSANNLRSMLKSQLDASTMNDYLFVLRDLYQSSAKALHFVIDYVSHSIVADVLAIPELVHLLGGSGAVSYSQDAAIPVISPLAGKIATVFNGSLIGFASAMPYSLMAQSGYKALQGLVSALKARSQGVPWQLQVDLYGLMLANNSPTLSNILTPLLAEGLANQQPSNSKDVTQSLIANNELFGFMRAFD